MPTFARTLDIPQGFSFKRDKQTPVGHVLNLTIGGTTLRPDLTIVSPEGLPSFAAVGVLSKFTWDTGATDPMNLTVQLSTANAQAAGGIPSGTNVAVVFQVVVFEYDPIKKKYFKSFFQNASLNGLIDNTASPTSFSLASQPSTEVANPANVALKLVIRPQGAAQTISIGTDAKTIVKTWGPA